MLIQSRAIGEVPMLRIFDDKDPLWGAAPHLPLSGGEVRRLRRDGALTDWCNQIHTERG